MILARCKLIRTSASLALLFPALLAAQDKPSVAVQFKIDAPNYQRNLYQKSAEVERKLEKTFAGIANQRFGFLAWKPFDPVQGRSTSSAALAVRMEERNPTPQGSSIWLMFAPQPGVRGTTFDCVAEVPVPARFDTMLGVLLYSRSEHQSGKPEDLEKRVVKELNEFFGNEDFRQALTDAFLGRIPLCHEARPLGGPFLALGIQQKLLRMDPRSRMVLRPCSRIPRMDKRDGEIGLELAKSRISEGEVAALVQAEAISCVFQPWIGAECLQKVPLILQHQLPHGIDVFMRRYFGAPEDTDRNRTTSPWKG